MLNEYTPMGVVDDFGEKDEDDGSKFSIMKKVRNMSRESARRRIDTIRKQNGILIDAKNHNMDTQNMDNIFLNSGKERNPYSLSVYNKSEVYKGRPFTAPNKDHWFKQFEPAIPAVQEEQDENEQPDTRLPEFKPPKEANMIVRGALEGYRQD